jgi:signal transduction histidine kinase
MKTPWKKPFKKYRHSLFLKLLILFILAGIAAELLVFSGMRYALVDDPAKRIGAKNIDKYFSYLIDDIGVPPEKEKIHELSSQIGLEMRVEDEQGTALFGHGLTSSDQLGQSTLRRHNVEGKMGRHEGQFFLIRENGGFRYIFFTPKGMPHEISEGVLTLVLLGLIVVIALTYLTTRRLLKPIKLLNAGMTRFGDGELDYRVEPKGRDELAGLSASFNAMATRIRDAMASKEQLLSDVSHELRSPITRAKVAMEFIEESKAKNDIGADISEMERIITLILETARLEKGSDGVSVQKGDLKELIGETQHTYEKTEPGLVVENLPDRLFAEFNSDLTRLVLRNVIENALKYAGGSTRPVVVTATVEPDKIVIEIQDFGPGIPKKEQVRVFEPFYRLDKSRQRGSGGLGLGLHFCKKAMDAQHGAIRLTSEPDGGTRVFLEFKAEILDEVL